MVYFGLMFVSSWQPAMARPSLTFACSLSWEICGHAEAPEDDAKRKPHDLGPFADLPHMFIPYACCIQLHQCHVEKNDT